MEGGAQAFFATPPLIDGFGAIARFRSSKQFPNSQNRDELNTRRASALRRLAIHVARESNPAQIAYKLADAFVAGIIDFSLLPQNAYSPQKQPKMEGGVPSG